MIAVVLLVLMLVLLAATPWRRLPMAGRFWAVAALLNTVVFFGMPTTPATSPWRPVVEWVLAASAATSLVLLVLGLLLRQRHAAATGGGGAWAAPLIIGGLPIVLYTFFLLTGAVLLSRAPGQGARLRCWPRPQGMVMPRHLIHIRHAQPTDADQWQSLRAALWPEEDSAVLGADVARFFAMPRREAGTMPEAVLVAAEDSRDPLVVGFAEISRRLYAEGCETSPVGFLEGWYVAPMHRRRGIGGALVAAAESWALAKGCREFASDALAENTVSAAAHHALGFDEVVIIRCFRKSLTLGAAS